MTRARPASRHARSGSFAAARPIQALGWTVAALIAVTVLGLAVFDRKSDPLCATRSQRALIQTELARNPRVWLVDLAHDIHVPESVILDALPDSDRVGVRGSELPAVWNLLRQQPDLVLALHNGRHTWRIRGALPELQLVERGDWNVGGDGDILSGRISTVDVGVIYAQTGRRADDPAWSVIFLNRGGEILFQIAPGAQAGTGSAVASSAAQAVLRRFRSLAPVCQAAG